MISAMDSVMMEAIKDGELNISRLNVSDLLSKVFNTLLTHRVKLDASFTSVMIAVTPSPTNESRLVKPQSSISGSMPLASA